MSHADAEKWYRELVADKDRIWFVIVLKRDGRVIGEAGLLRMFRPWRRTDMTIIIGERMNGERDTELKREICSLITPSDDWASIGFQ